MDFEEFKTQYSEKQIEDVLKEFWHTKKAQSGSDVKAAKALEEKKELEEKLKEQEVLLREGNDDLRSVAQKMQQREQLLSLREKALEYGIEQGISPKIAVSMAIQDEATTLGNIDDLVAEIDKASGTKTDQAIKNRFGKGHQPMSGERNDGLPRTYEELIAKDNKWLEKRPNLVNKLMEKFVARDNRRYQ